MSINYAKRLLLLAFVILMIPDIGTAGAQQCVWTDVETIVAVGDVHGDFHRFVDILREARVINEKHKWIAGTTHLVQNGDVLDRGPDSKKVMDLLMELEIQAASHGGAVHALIGNHEAMIMQKDLRYVHTGETASHGGEAGYRNNMAPDGKYGSWICRHNAVIRINDTVFVHGGISSKYAMGLSLEQINNRIREELKQPDKKWDESYVRDSDGPLWYRGWAQMSDDDVAKALPAVLAKLSAKRMVIGHTVSKDGIQKRCDSQVIMIDVGLSRAYGGTPACIKIEGDRVVIIESVK